MSVMALVDQNISSPTVCVCVCLLLCVCVYICVCVCVRFAYRGYALIGKLATQSPAGHFLLKDPTTQTHTHTSKHTHTYASNYTHTHIHKVRNSHWPVSEPNE